LIQSGSLNNCLFQTQACGVSCHGAASVIGPHADTHTSSHFFIYQYKVRFLRQLLAEQCSEWCPSRVIPSSYR
jgi:hypothetical protein